MVKTGAIDRSPADHVKTGSFMPKRRKLPNEADVKAWEALARSWVESDHPTQIRDGAMWLLVKATGARLREALELRRSDVILASERGPEKGGVYVLPSFGRTGEAILRVPLLEMHALKRWLEYRSARAVIDRAFITTKRSATRNDPSKLYRPLNRHAVSNIFVRLSQAAGVERPIRSHALRHRIAHLVTKRYRPKVAAILLIHADWKTAGTAIAFYHHPGESDVNMATANPSAEKIRLELEEMTKLFGVDKKP